MTLPSGHPDVPLRIQSPCPKSWGELTGSGGKRFCSECSLYVHDATQLTSAQARELVTGASSRVCMRMEYDTNGAPVFLDTLPSQAAQPKLVRFARWALTATAGLLAACHGEVSTLAPNDPSAGTDPAPTTTRMGKICAPTMGEVAVPPPVERMGSVAPPPRVERLGDVALPLPAPDAPVPHDD